MLIKPKDFFEKNPNFVFPRTLDDPEMDVLRLYVENEQFNSPAEEVKCRWTVPHELKNGELKPNWSTSYWYKSQPGYREVPNFKFFSAFKFKTVTARQSNEFHDMDGRSAYIFNQQLNEIINKGYLFNYGWILGEFVFIKRGKELGVRPYDPDKDKLTGLDPFRNVSLQNVAQP